ncbi:MAG: hypothetical protein WCR72_10630 [Bacteroidota bacterium]
MKDIIISYLTSDRSFDEGLRLYMIIGNSMALKNSLNRQGYSEYNHSVLLEEFRKLAGIAQVDFEDMISKRQADAPAFDAVAATTPENNTPVTGEEKQVFLAEIPENIRKSIRLRDDFPFLALPGCPDEFKILVHDMLTDYSLYVEAHKRLFAATSDEELLDAASGVVENYLENREIWDELNYFAEFGKVLGIHPIFSTTERMLEIRNMSTAELVKLNKALLNNIARTKKLVLDDPEHANTQERKQKLAKWDVELFTVNDLLGITPS